MLVQDAAAKLDQYFDGGSIPPLYAPIRVSVGGHQFTLDPVDVDVKLDALKTAKRAYYAGLNRPANAKPADGAAAYAPDVPLAIDYARAKLTQFVAKVNRDVYIAPRDATLRITLRRMITRRAHEGRDLDDRAFRKLVIAALTDPTGAPHDLKPGRNRVHVAVNTQDLRRIYGTVLTVDRTHFKLRLFKHLRFSKSYGIAVGMAGLDTPAGRYAIHEKQVNPPWHVPHSAWAGSLQGQTIPGGAPNNPLKARWLGIANGVGIHGTAEDWSIGSRASHGCIRMHVSDVIDLYPRVPVGTTVLIQ
jgi:hypothetical protein